jgi:hypothetical protein
MSAKHGFAGTVFLVLLAGPLAQAQVPTDLPYLKPPADVTIPADSALPGLPSVLSQQPKQWPPALDTSFTNESWLYEGTGTRACGPVGANGPIGTELYFRTGPSWIVGGTGLAGALRIGYDVVGGGRTLFYTADGTRAWIFDANVSYTANGGTLNQTFPGLYGPGDNVTIRGLNRTALSLGIGHDWWICGPGDVGSYFNPNFRYGADGGAQYGTSHLDLNTTDTAVTTEGYERIQKIYAGAYAGAHFDMEMPMGAWTFVSSIRGEWVYNSLHLLPGNNTIQGFNLLFSVGLRY